MKGKFKKKIVAIVATGAAALSLGTGVSLASNFSAPEKASAGTFDLRSDPTSKYGFNAYHWHGCLGTREFIPRGGQSSGSNWLDAIGVQANVRMRLTYPGGSTRTYGPYYSWHCIDNGVSNIRITVKTWYDPVY